MMMKNKKRAASCILILFGSLLSIFRLIALEDNALVYIISIRNEIGSGLRVYISNGIRRAEDDNADAIIFDVDTPGGRVDAAVKIVDTIQRTKIPTIAYVNREAISAGALISLACDQIVMTSGGTIGDVAPVTIQGQELGEKAVSYIRATIRSTAERQGRNPDVAAAMVDKRLYLVRLEDGEIVALRPDAYNERKEAGEEMEVIVAGAAEGGDDEDSGDSGELLTLTTEEALQYNLVDGQADTIEDLLAMYQIVEINEEYKALTEEVVLQKQTELGTARVKVIRSLKRATIQEVSVTLADQIVFFITSPLISSILLSLGAIGLFVEIRTPGFGVPGILGLLCLGLFFGGHMLLQIEAEWAAMAFVIGVGLLLLEIFVIPGFGVAGILGLMFMLGSVFYIFKNAYELEDAILWLSVSVVLTFGLSLVLVYFLPKTRAWQHFVLETAMDSEMGYHSAAREDFQSYLGQTGIALTPLRPAGTMRFGTKRLDVVTVGDFIEPETHVKIVDVEGSKIFVETVDET
jgi:membrane-bound serine protease (ClpP class)